jgi:hypothetical protein
MTAQRTDFTLPELARFLGLEHPSEELFGQVSRLIETGLAKWDSAAFGPTYRQGAVFSVHGGIETREDWERLLDACGAVLRLNHSPPSHWVRKFGENDDDFRQRIKGSFR